MTRFGLLSDVHANLPALQAGLAALHERDVDQLLVAGDLVGYGGHPNECVEMLAEQQALCVAGNHDLFVLDRLPPTRFPDLARRSADITRDLLSEDVRHYLAALPTTLRVGPVLMAHGSPGDPEEYVGREARAQELLDRLPQDAPGADTLLLGHTHHQFCVTQSRGAVRARGRVDLAGSGRRLLNPGSTGQSRQREHRPRVRAAVYDSTRQEVEFLVADYDVETSTRRLAELGLPPRCMHAPPPLHRRVRTMAKRLIRSPGRR